VAPFTGNRMTADEARRIDRVADLQVEAGNAKDSRRRQKCRRLYTVRGVSSVGWRDV
jgi:hypothetical protein